MKYLARDENYTGWLSLDGSQVWLDYSNHLERLKICIDKSKRKIEMNIIMDEFVNLDATFWISS